MADKHWMTFFVHDSSFQPKYCSRVKHDMNGVNIVFENEVCLVSGVNTFAITIGIK